jgi:hypothetical protein
MEESGRGLNMRVQAAGTEPDPTVSPAVAAHLTPHVTQNLTRPRRSAIDSRTARHDS